MKAYFDRNIFGDLKATEDGGESAEKFSALRAAVNEKRLTVLLSTTVLEETLPALNLSPSILRQDLQVIFGLVQKRRMIKSAGDLLTEAVQSYAYDRRLPDMLTRTPRFLEDFLVKGRVSRALREFVDAVIAQGSEFTANFTETFLEARRVGEERNVGTPEDFGELWNVVAPAIAENWAKHCGLYERCVERGMEGLLEARAVRLYAIYYTALIHSKWFGEQGTPGKVIASEKGDFHHSVQAAAADVFVTRDRRLTRWLRKIPVESFEVLNLDELLERL